MIQEIALNPLIQRLWKASKIYGVPIYDPKVVNLNAYDLSLIEWLIRFDNPEIDDYEVISQVHKEIQDYTRTFREQLHQGNDSGNSTESTDTEVMEGK